MASTNNAIALTAAGIVSYDGAGIFTGNPVTLVNILSGGASNTIVNIAPPSQNGVPLISQGTGTTPIFGTALVPGGGTGLTSTSAYQIIAGGTSSTGALQQVNIGTTGQILVSGGSGALASFQTIPSVITSWVVQGSSVTASPAIGYFVTASATITLPTGLATGATISIWNYFGASVVINAGTGQTINIGPSTSSSGGTATSASDGDTVTLVFRSGALSWNAVSVIGTWVLA